jgi:hypothetical protein
VNLKENFNEKLTNSIDHKYIDRSFLFSKRFLKRSFYIIIIAKFGLLNIVIIEVDELMIYLSQDHMDKIILVYLFIYTIL